MSFSDYKAPSTVIDTPNGDFIVHGLSVDDLSGLIQRHGALIETWFEGDIDPAQTVIKAPALVADIIACGAGQPEDAAKAAAMPIGLQIRVFSEIAKLTFSEVDMGNALRLFVTTFAGTKQPGQSNRDI